MLAVLRDADGYIRIQQQQQSALPDSDVPIELAFSAVDLSPWGNQRRTIAPSPPCGMEARFSGLEERGSTDDQAICSSEPMQNLHSCFLLI